MGKIYQGIEELIGHTPLVALNRYAKQQKLVANILVKLESFNPAGSVKDRATLNMILAKEEAGEIRPGGTIIEGTSGNTGIAIAAIGAARGYNVKICMPDDVSIERRKLIKSYGGDVILTPGAEKMGGAGQAAAKLLEENENAVIIGQGANPNNPDAHYKTTGPEIWEDTEGNVDIFVAAAGTGGTLRGISDFVKEKNPGVKVIAVEPTPDDRILTGIHNFTEVPEDRIPANLKGKEGIFDEVLIAQPEGAFKAAREVAKSDGVLVGNSSGAALWGATQIAQRPEFEGKKIVVVFPDTGLRYLTTDLFNE